ASALAVHRHAVDRPQDGADHREGKERFGGQVIDLPFDTGADQRRVKKAGVIGGQDNRPLERYPLRMVHPPMKIGGESEPAEEPAEAVGELHFRAANRFRTSPMISPLVCSEVSRELLMTIAPSGIISGAVARWLSRWSRAARFSSTPSAARRLIRSSSEASR